MNSKYQLQPIDTFDVELDEKLIEDLKKLPRFDHGFSCYCENMPRTWRLDIV